MVINVCGFRTPEEWLALGDVDDFRWPLPAMAFLPQTKMVGDQQVEIYDWAVVSVTAYDEKVTLYFIFLLFSYSRKVQECGNYKRTIILNTNAAPQVAF